MTRLLVSVRSPEEAESALRGGADVIDVKEPAHGPLGRSRPEIQQAILAAVAGRAPVSAAMGELNDVPIATPPGFALAKWGLADSAVDWRDRWRHARDSLPSNCRPVAVAYADGGRVGAPPLPDVLAFAIEERAGAFLIDTAIKDNGGLLDHVSHQWMRDILAEASQYDLPVALAGSLDAEAIQLLLPMC